MSDLKYCVVLIVCFSFCLWSGSGSGGAATRLPSSPFKKAHLISSHSVLNWPSSRSEGPVICEMERLMTEMNGHVMATDGTLLLSS